MSVIGLARSSLQYRQAPRDDDALRLALIRLAKQYGRYGYRKIAELLHVEGWKINHKKVERLSSMNSSAARSLHITQQRGALSNQSVIDCLKMIGR
ncbi:MAG: transposase [Paracoccaceae bacterium]